jgi:hypothetical protein
LDDGHGGRKDARAFLEQHGVTFGAGASATIKPDSSTLVLKNTPEQIKVAIGVLARFPGVVLGPHDLPIRKVKFPLLPTPPIAGMPGGSTAASEPVNTIGVLKEFPGSSIDVGRATLAAELNQDPQASASRYAAIVANFDAQRRSAATAVYGLGEAYRKMGRNAEARIQYARILREFVDFPELARQSQRQLSTTSPSAPDPEFVGAMGGGNADAAEEERALAQQELALLERQLTLTQDRIQAGLMPQSEALSLQRDILRLKQQLVRLSRGSGRPPGTTPPSADGAHGDHEPAPARGQ